MKKVFVVLVLLSLVGLIVFVSGFMKGYYDHFVDQTSDQGVQVSSNKISSGQPVINDSKTILFAPTLMSHLRNKETDAVYALISEHGLKVTRDFVSGNDMRGKRFERQIEKSNVPTNLQFAVPNEAPIDLFSYWNDGSVQLVESPIDVPDISIDTFGDLLKNAPMNQPFIRMVNGYTVLIDADDESTGRVIVFDQESNISGYYDFR